MKKRICVVTGSRAEYGILKPLLQEIAKTPSLHLQIIVTGTHLSRNFGLTYKEIENDGFVIDEKIKIVGSSDSPRAITEALGKAVCGFARAFEVLAPDMIVVLGDRYEIFGAVSAACVARIPVAHLHGGERTEGAIDDAFRHAISKMSLLHFTAAAEYQQRVVQMGENPARVFNVGSLALDTIATRQFFSKKELEKKLGIVFGTPLFLITYHPVTLENNTSKKDFNELLVALDTFKSATCIFTYANADTQGIVINESIERYVKKNPHRMVAVPSLGMQTYLSLMKCADAVVGNSSSGIIEAPSLKKPTVNIGDRQKGRLKAASVLDCIPKKEDIVNALQKAISKDFGKSLIKVKNLYGSGNVAKKIVKEFLKKILLKKEFYDVPST